ncbi:MAG: thioredoxin [Candidatus Hydrothermarchaeales archaeon]
MEFTEQNFEKEVLNSNIPVMVDFWGSWCPPCKMMEPLVDQLKEEYNGRVKIGKINVDRNQTIPRRYNIAGVPTFILFKRGKEVDRKIGAVSIEAMRKFIEVVL